jgi:hypothetical protein
MFTDILFDLVPVSPVIPDFFTGCTDRDKAFKHPDT